MSFFPWDLYTILVKLRVSNELSTSAFNELRSVVPCTQTYVRCDVLSLSLNLTCVLSERTAIDGVRSNHTHGTNLDAGSTFCTSSATLSSSVFKEVFDAGTKV